MMNKKFFALMMLCLLGLGVQAWGMESGIKFESESLSKVMQKLFSRSENDPQEIKRFEEESKKDEPSLEKQEKLRTAVRKIRDGDIKSFKRCFKEEKLDPNSQCMKDCLSFLCQGHMVNKKRSAEPVRYLLEHGADPNGKTIISLPFTSLCNRQVQVTHLEHICLFVSWSDKNRKRQVHLAELLLGDFERLPLRAKIHPLLIELAQEKAKNPELVTLLKKAYWQNEQQVALADLRRKSKGYQDCVIRCIYRDKQDMKNDN